MHLCRRFVWLAALSLASLGAQAQSIIFEDTEFVPADWTFTTVLSGNGGFSGTEQPLGGGNPGAFRKSTRTFGPYDAQSAPHNILQTHLFIPAVHDPAASGAIESVSFAFDVTAFTTTNLAVALVAIQDGVRYFHGYRTDLTPALVFERWLTHSGSSLNEADFNTDPGAMTGTSPDFTASGSPIQFGYFTGNTQDPAVMPGVGYAVIDGFDNFSVSLTVSASPCPGDIADDFGLLGADGMVSFGDFLALLGLVGPCPGGVPGCTGDIADDFGVVGPDGMVSFGDFLALLGLVGPCP